MELKRKGKQEGCTTPDRKEGQSGEAGMEEAGGRNGWVAGRQASKREEADRLREEPGRQEITDGQASNKRGGRLAESGAPCRQETREGTGKQVSYM